MAKKTYELKMLVNEEETTGTFYMIRKSAKGMKTTERIRKRKYDPVLRCHCWFIEKKLPNPKAK